jgi:hypothetical protein
VEWLRIESTDAVRFVVLLVAVSVVFGLVILALRYFAGGRSFKNPRGRQPRLAVMDVASVDARRRLVLVRRDNVEHLILIGGPNDLIVEPTIVRGMPVGSTPRIIQAPPPTARPEGAVRAEPQLSEAGAPQGIAAPTAPTAALPPLPAAPLPMQSPIQPPRAASGPPPASSAPPPSARPPVTPRPATGVTVAAAIAGAAGSAPYVPPQAAVPDRPGTTPPRTIEPILDQPVGREAAAKTGALDDLALRLDEALKIGIEDVAAPPVRPEAPILPARTEPRVEPRPELSSMPRPEAARFEPGAASRPLSNFPRPEPPRSEPRPEPRVEAPRVEPPRPEPSAEAARPEPSRPEPIRSDPMRLDLPRSEQAPGAMPAGSTWFRRPRVTPTVPPPEPVVVATPPAPIPDAPLRPDSPVDDTIDWTPDEDRSLAAKPDAPEADGTWAGEGPVREARLEDDEDLFGPSPGTELETEPETGDEAPKAEAPAVETPAVELPPVEPEDEAPVPVVTVEPEVLVEDENAAPEVELPKADEEPPVEEAPARPAASHFGSLEDEMSRLLAELSGGRDPQDKPRR